MSKLQSAKVFGEIKIGFDASHGYTAELTSVEDATETVEANKITADDFQVAENVLTAKESLLTKVRAIDSSAQPTSKTITINFTLKANDQSLKNSTQTLPVEVKFTHAQNIDDTSRNDIQDILQKGSSVRLNEDSPVNPKSYTFEFSSGIYDKTAKTFTVENANTDNLDMPYSKVYEYADFNFTTQLKDYVTGTRSGAGELSQDKKSFTLTYDVKFNDVYETAVTQIKVILKNNSTSANFKDDTTQP